MVYQFLLEPFDHFQINFLRDSEGAQIVQDNEHREIVITRNNNGTFETGLFIFTMAPDLPFKFTTNLEKEFFKSFPADPTGLIHA